MKGLVKKIFAAVSALFLVVMLSGCEIFVSSDSTCSVNLTNTSGTFIGRVKVTNTSTYDQTTVWEYGTNGKSTDDKTNNTVKFSIAPGTYQVKVYTWAERYYYSSSSDGNPSQVSEIIFYSGNTRNLTYNGSKISIVY